MRAHKDRSYMTRKEGGIGLASIIKCVDAIILEESKIESRDSLNTEASKYNSNGKAAIIKSRKNTSTAKLRKLLRIEKRNLYLKLYPHKEKQKKNPKGLMISKQKLIIRRRIASIVNVVIEI